MALLFVRTLAYDNIFKIKHLGREVLDDALAVDELLEEEARDRDHREAAVLELLRGHLREPVWKSTDESLRVNIHAIEPTRKEIASMAWAPEI